uniref:Coiled-coil domain containing 157 n=1 Tax=Lepisosteus oculatus TaxID=7918 RepID=W5MNP2_LEPOC|nr:PREDICTED: coiled-coil domain-containing protein 157 isoform X1 [Lepisosteus oculatus]XP_015221460.1 PREDICTED: coiled-coil domain-containing protein 157 isoform X1 [Lepisosteus oculatus]XP_015221461.1 PREDICTED: coiled-coil domain-containing protein 157 isoform X1 [Lepisosteus oculatus]
MSHLLGRQDCVDSLRRDLTDLQGTVLDVFSRTGPIRSPSWKFPDKLSCNLDLVTLLEQYDFVEGEEEFNQHSHIVLLELVVDRLVLLLQSFSGFTEGMLGGQRSGSQTGAAGPSTSIGLAVRCCWNNLLRLGTLHQCTLRQGKKMEQGALTLQAEEQVPSRENANSSAPTLKSAENSNLSCPLSSTSGKSSGKDSTTCSKSGIAKDTRTVGCQTLESALVPCDACSRSQASLREVSNALIAVCQTQNLPSSLARFMEVMDSSLENGQLSASDLAYWASEQSKDLARISKHLAALLGMVQPLKESLAASEAQRGVLRDQLERMERVLSLEKEEHQTRLREMDLRLEKMNTKNTEVVSKLQGEQEELRKETLSLEEKNSKLREELSLQQDSLQKLEQERQELLEEIKTRLVDREVTLGLEERVRSLDTELCSTELQLYKERVKTQSLGRLQESLQAKQKVLVQRVNALDQECEVLMQRLADSEEDSAVLEERLSESSQDRAGLQAELAQQRALTEELQKEKERLEKSVGDLHGAVSRLQGQLQEQAQKERLLVAFPDLCNPTPCAPETTGDVLLDMEQQMQANSIRISVLEEENSRLRNSLNKLRDSAHRREMKVLSPQQLWSHADVSPTQSKPVPAAPSHSTGDRDPYSGMGQELGVGRRAGEIPGHRDRRSPAAPSSSSPSPTSYRLAPAISLPEEASAISPCSRLRQASHGRGSAARPKKK